MPGSPTSSLAKKAKAICVAYDGMDRFFPAASITKTGNPVRTDLENCTLTQAEAKRQLGFDSEKLLVLAVGGSLGARTVNQAIAASLPMLLDKGVSLMWQTGRYGAPEFQKTCRRL